MSTFADELLQLADDAARARGRLEELARACAELRAQLAHHEPATAPVATDATTSPSATEDTPQRLQSVS